MSNVTADFIKTETILGKFLELFLLEVSMKTFADILKCAAYSFRYFALFF